MKIMKCFNSLNITMLIRMLFISVLTSMRYLIAISSASGSLIILSLTDPRERYSDIIYIC